MPNNKEDKNLGIKQRKKQHIDLVLDQASQVGLKAFSDYALPYNCLPELNLKDVATETKLFGKTLSQPLIIASMTGGSQHAFKINENLAIAAEKTGVAMGVGSQRIALELTDARKSFEVVRKHAPTAVIFANMGAVQLNYGYKPTHYQEVVNIIGADALYLHINPLQESLQPEGDTNFSGLASKIAKVVETVKVPVFVKEVGHGISAEAAEKFIKAGVSGIDVAGMGGTSWAWVEAKRAENQEFIDWFKDFGLTTAESLTQVAALSAVKDKNITLVASGGLRSPLQAIKARALGADFYSAAEPFLKPALTSPEAVIEKITNWEKGLRIGLFNTGILRWDEARKLHLLTRNRAYL